MSSSSDAAVEVLLATSHTARCHNPLFRQQQLKSLHDALRNNVQQLRDAIRLDTGVTEAEITIEIATVLNVVKEQYAGIGPKKELTEEHKVNRQENAVDKTESLGVVYIEPELQHTPFFSVVVPLSIALAAGNCVALKLEMRPQLVPALLRTLLPQALESDTFQIVTSSPSPETISQRFPVLENDKETPPPTYSQLVPSGGRVIAVVDRTANLPSAAEYLVNARFAFGGKSPYAPDIVLVNEFAKREFLEHVLNHAMPFLFSSANPTSNGQQSESRASRSVSKNVKAFEEDKNWHLSIITRGPNGIIAELTSSAKTYLPLPPTSSIPLFCISAITSLEHAIDLISSDSDDQLLAAYHFAAPAHTKHLTQFIKSEISFANHVPASLLLGPVAPIGHSGEYVTRSTKDQSVRPSPLSVARSTSQVSLSARSSKDADKLLSEATKEIGVKKRAEWMSLGFFEQGLLIRLGFYGIPILACVGSVLYFGIRTGIRRWTSS